jgi:hypothetical protein
MGAIAEAIVGYAQPMIDATDGSEEQLNHAMTMSQLFWNLALLPQDKRDQLLLEMQPTLKMNDEEFGDFRWNIVEPMIRRHEEMFPQLHRNFPMDFSSDVPSLREQPRIAASTEKYPGTERYAPCPCHSGRKYKFCCGKKAR